jgi:hypothetical protein
MECGAMPAFHKKILLEPIDSDYKRLPDKLARKGDSISPGPVETHPQRIGQSFRIKKKLSEN